MLKQELVTASQTIAEKSIRESRDHLNMEKDAKTKEGKEKEYVLLFLKFFILLVATVRAFFQVFVHFLMWEFFSWGIIS